DALFRDGWKKQVSFRQRGPPPRQSSHSYQLDPPLEFLSLFRTRLEAQGIAVHAVAQAGRLWPILENMAEMRFAIGATDLRPPHPPGIVAMLADRAGFDRLIEARPA